MPLPLIIFNLRQRLYKMRLLRSTIVFFALAVQAMAQGNLVPNWSFEYYSTCPNSNGQFYLVNNWNNPTNGSPEYFDTCVSSGISIPSNIFGYQNTHSGGGYAGLVVYYGTYMEYIQTQLNEPLQAGKTYCVSFYVSLAELSDFASIGPQLYFSNTAISSSTFLRFPYVPQIYDTVNIIYDTTAWTLISGEYIAQGGERYLTIGNFREEADTPHDSINNTTSGASYFFIDDVSVFKKLEADAGNDHIFCVGDSLQLGEVNLDSGIVFSWSPITGLSDSVSPNPWAKPLTTTTYKLTISDTGGLYCTGDMIDSVTITVNNCTPPPQFSIPTILKSTEILFISALPENSTLELYDARGRRIMREENYQNNFSPINLAAGIYAYKLSTPGGNSQSGKICIVK